MATSRSPSRPKVFQLGVAVDQPRTEEVRTWRKRAARLLPGQQCVLVEERDRPQDAIERQWR
jgi:hypothetical protein